MTTLTKEAIHYINYTKTMKPYYQCTPQEAREMKAVPSWTASTPLAAIDNRVITMRDGAQINIRLYIPTFAKELPVIIYYHGGGWVFGTIESTDAGCQLLAQQAQAIVVSVDYRLAPEHPFPTPLHDAYDSLLWVYEHIQQFGGNRHQLTVAGDSAGGNLATVVAYLATSNNGPAIQAQILIYPVTNLDFTTTSYQKYGEHYGLDTLGMQWFAAHYTEEKNYLHPLVSPLQIDQLQAMPKTLLIAAQADVLYDEGLAYAEKLATAGVTVQHLTMPGLIHSYFSKTAFFEQDTRETVQKMASFLQMNSL
ncbi:alpha/beta hydrolase [Lysinibacillus piscis]|uniref:Esterase n=1 Tax=Lysinibacillus piscis TaxID=2518931 RepID=A0ABQ5NMB1_9BACI|nr:alpha/beta hydrolase [Lysinibacillus sp. KH24]GLC89164.1 esterase [Lysinibacillus sp. KH24]